MQTVKALIKAGQPSKFPMRGKVFFLQQADQGNNVSVRFESGNSELYEIDGIGQSFKGRPQGGFSGLTISATVDTNIVFIITDGDIDLQFLQATVTIGNGVGNPVPVSLQTAANFTASNVAISNDAAHPVPVSLVSEPGAPVPVSGTVNIGNAAGSPVPVSPIQGTTITDAAPVAVPAFTGGSPNQVQVIAAGARRTLRIRNAATSGTLYIGSGTVTPTNGAVALKPGDLWIETDAPNAAWYATSDTGATANVQVIA